MIQYNLPPSKTYEFNGVGISSFIRNNEENVDLKTIESFGSEWTLFHSFDKNELHLIGLDYFDQIDLNKIKNFYVLDIGCGSGRWAYFLADHVKFIEAIDPSTSVFAAAQMLKDSKNVRITHASVEGLPFPNDTFDMVYSLGVLHHLPNTHSAIRQCYNKTKSGGIFLLYLYYNLDNRGLIYRTFFQLSNLARQAISKFPFYLKKGICDLMAIIIYWPLARICRLLENIFPQGIDKIPLSYYRDKSFYIMRNDSLDRFGTPLEKRFSKNEITKMLTDSGFTNIQFSNRKPYWHAIAQKP